MQFQIMNSPFNQEQAELLNRLLPTLTEGQKIWLSGYLAVSQTTEPAVAASLAVQEAPGQELGVQTSTESSTREITILVGSHTGNCQSLADDMKEQLKQQDYKVVLYSMDDFKPKSLKKVEDLLILTSTHGDGDPPDNTIGFYDFLHSKRAPKLEGLRFSVLALGDSSYEFYCQTGKDFDKRLEELGGERLYPRVDCDLDFEDPAAEWFEGVLGVLNQSKQSSQPNSQQDLAIATTGTTAETTYSRKNPFKAEILENLNLNGRGSNKETRHLELDLEDSNLTFEPGDSLGVYPENDPVLVDQLIEAAGWDANELVETDKDGGQQSLRDALVSTYEITSLTKPLLEKAAELSENDELKQLIQPEKKEELKTYIEGRDLIDLINDFGPWNTSAPEFIKILRKIPVRLYSIASSLKANPDEVHITVGAVRYDAHGRARSGVCSTQCAERSQPGDTLPVFIQRNQNFRLPENPDTPVIMIGAGTGVAPYRAFLEEREELGAQGDAWLFFGEQHFVSDFLYQIEWQNWLKEGVLTRMDVAFSRDTDEKVYVQHRMQERSHDLYQWIEAGAHVYVCGDEKHMAKDVHATLVEILKSEGGMNQDDAEAFLSDMRKQKRYQRDVY
ncbi:assimilatory sulfite reductase (NADPH) flavoprotein subunit [Sediminibacillus massiliensis]|uniref:assimilatory sulfite reductase (NADPH) flavoprotein subunit n=1 Tax=Sediminibacillus massiliensis TaxID=1926277 RepID=UPI0009887404|nr:assimilatory sulfite reductase (NADPH) flavoprotein subunit [Sediminibacillus massiliensis]